MTEIGRCPFCPRGQGEVLLDPHTLISLQQLADDRGQVEYNGEHILKVHSGTSGNELCSHLSRVSLHVGWKPSPVSNHGESEWDAHVDWKSPMLASLDPNGIVPTLCKERALGRS